jgi:hypothetical protein
MRDLIWPEFGSEQLVALRQALEGQLDAAAATEIIPLLIALDHLDVRITSSAYALPDHGR